jgi:6-phosphogluconolactonase (cycloisomerase 2 family)
MEMRKRDAPRRTSSFDDFIQQLGNDIDGEAANDYSGYSVAVSADGTRVAIGARHSGGNGYQSGQVRVYEWNDEETLWTQVGQDIDGEAAADQSGWSVAMSADGKHVAIGARYNGGNGSNSGHVRVYDLNEDEGVWGKVGEDIDGEAELDYSGWSVAMSADGKRIAIGAIGNDANGLFSGHVRVYDLNDKEWTQVGEDIDGEAEYDESGSSIAMSADGTRIAIGAMYNRGNGWGSGQVRVYDVNDEETLWTQVGQDIDGEAAGDQSGSSVAMSADGTRIAIGAYFNDGAGGRSGHVRVYDVNDEETEWTQVGPDIDGEASGDKSGSSVAMSADGTRIAIGAYFNDGAGGRSGHVRVYDVNDEETLWTQVDQDIEGEAADDYSGCSVAMSADGTRVAIGAYGNKGDGAGWGWGHVRVYEVRGFLYPCVLHVFACVPKFCTNLNMSQCV